MIHTPRPTTLVIIAVIVLALLYLTSRALLPFLLIGGAILAYLALRRPHHQAAHPTHAHPYAPQRADLAPVPSDPHEPEPTTADGHVHGDAHGHGCGHGHGGGHAGEPTRRGGCC